MRTVNMTDEDQAAIWNAIDGLQELADWIDTHEGNDDRAESWRETAEWLNGMMRHATTPTD
jgi:hypothetical protein